MKQKYEMPAVTEEQRQELIELCEAVLAGHVQYGGDSNEEDIYKIALAALTAHPVTYAIQDEQERKEGYMTEFSTSGLEGYVSPEKYGLTELALYTAPPAPVLKSIVLQRGIAKK